jgi:hypothetical protein
MTEHSERSMGERALSTAESEAALEAIVESEDPGDLGAAAADTEAAGAAAASSTAARRRSRTRTATTAATVSGPPASAGDAVTGDTVNIVQGGAQTIEAGSVTLQQGGAQSVRADRVDIRQGGAGRVEGGEVSVRQGAIGVAQGERIHLEMGAIAVAIGTNVEVHQGFARFVGARESARLEQAGAMTVIANRVDMAPQSGAVFLIAREVHGDARSVFDWRASAAFGAAFAVVLTLLRSVRARR